MTFPVAPDFLVLDAPESADKPDDPFAKSYTPPPQPQPRAVVCKDYPLFFAAGTTFDAAPILRKAGIEMREGKDLALFHPPDSTLYVRCTRESAGLLSQFVGGIDDSAPASNIEIEVIIVGMRGPTVFHALQDSDDPRLQAEKLAAEDGQILARALVLTRSGQRALMGQGTRLQAKDAPPGAGPTPAEGHPAIPPAFASTAGPGIRLEVEPTLGADGDAMDVSWDCSFGLPAHEAGAPLVQGHIVSMITISSGRTAMQRLSVEGTKWSEVALLLGATRRSRDTAGWKDGQRLLSSRQQRWRDLGKAGERK